MNLHACVQSAQNINLPAINGVVMQTPDDADSSAENRQGTKMNVPRAETRKRMIALLLALIQRALVLSRGLLYVVQNTRDMLQGANPRLLCYDLRA
jgi:hypothetical protein